MKKFILTITLITILCNMLCTAAFSEAASTVALSSATVRPGETAEITVSLSKAVKLGSLQLCVDYDNSNMSITNFTNICGKSGLSNSEDFKITPYKFGWLLISGIDFSGDIYSIEFTVSESAPLGKYPVKISYFTSKKNIFDKNENIVYLNYLSSFITVTDNTDDYTSPEYSLCLDSQNAALGGKLVAALYNNDGQLVESKFYNAQETVDISFSQKGDYIKLMQWNMDKLMPLTDFHRIEAK